MVVRPVGVVQSLPLVVVRTGHTAVRQGEPCADLWTVESGLFTSRVVDPEGRSFLMDILGPGDAIGAPGERPALVTATALRPARLRPVRDEDAVQALESITARVNMIASQLAWFGVTRADRAATVRSRAADRPPRARGHGHPDPADAG